MGSGAGLRCDGEGWSGPKVPEPETIGHFMGRPRLRTVEGRCGGCGSPIAGDKGSGGGAAGGGDGGGSSLVPEASIGLVSVVGSD